MPLNSVRIGPPTIQLPVDSSTAVPACTTLTFTACAVTPTELLLNDVNAPLSASDTYQVIVGLVGRDTTNGGYTVGRCSPSSGDLSVTAGQIIEVNVSNSDWPANFQYAGFAAIFLKINSADFQLAGFAYIDDAADFSYSISAKPLRVSPKFTSALLQSTTADSILGDRTPYGYTYETIEPLTGTINIRRATTTVNVSPANAPDYTIATSRAPFVSFQSLINDVKAWVQAAAGNYAKYDSSGDTIQIANMSLNTAQALLKGNRPLKLTMPIDPVTQSQEIRMYIGNLLVNQTELTEAWDKAATTPVSFQFDAASLDKLINNQHTELVYQRY